MFKIGSRVKCISRHGSLVVGEVYTVIKNPRRDVDSGFISVKEILDGANAFSKARFVAAHTFKGNTK